MDDPIEWQFDVPASQVDIDRIYRECSEMNVFARAGYLVALEKNAPKVFERYCAKFAPGK